MLDDPRETPADEFERQIDAERRLARRAVKRFALKSLISFASLPVMLSMCCLVGPLLIHENFHVLYSVLGYAMMLLACVAGLFGFGTAVCAGVLTYRDWSLLEWRTQAMGIAPWLVVSGVCLLLLLAVLA